MKSIVFVFLILSQVCFSQRISQRFYLTKDGVSALTKKLQECKALEKKLILSNDQVLELKNLLIERQVYFDRQVSILDSSLIRTKYDLSELQKKYEETIKLIPKRKRKRLIGE